MSDMVGYFNTTEGGRGTQHQGPPPLMEPHSTGGGELPVDAPVKRVVCSPDLPVFSLTQAFEEAAVESSTATTTTTPDKVYQCSFCQKSFSQKNTYQNHLRSHGKEGEDPYQCNICGKTFAVPARLTRHYRTHTGEKPYQCEYCNKSFSVKENLSVHRRIHTKERPYKCDICERAFEHSGKLHRHMRIHTGERPHKCDICAKTFIQSGQLVIHMRTHTGEKPYVCKVCGKGFTCSKQLKVHTRTHTGEKPYTCDICGKSFGYNHVLKLHQVAHFGEKVYKCTICNETFTNKKTMEVHIKSHSEPTARSPLPQGRPDMVESSCASSSSDKENKADSDCEPPPRAPSLANSSASEFDPPSPVMVIPVPLPPQAHPHPNMSELCHYLYPRSPPYQQHGVNPVLLAAAAAAAASEGRSLSPLPHHVDEETFRRRQHEVDISSCTRNSVPVGEPHLPVTEPSVYLCPEPLASMQRRSPYHFQLPPPDYLEEPPVLINLPLAPMYRGRRREEHRSPEPMLTPPSSNPVSPVPSSSPDPIDLAIVNRQVLSLPPRKRSKMILQSMETAESEMASVRYSSVIHYAKAS